MTGNQLHTLRVSRNMTKYKLSTKLGISLGTLNRWEREDFEIPHKYYARIKRTFDLEFYELVTRKYRTDEEKIKLQKQRIECMERMDRKSERWHDLPENDPDLNTFRKLVGA